MDSFVHINDISRLVESIERGDLNVIIDLKTKEPLSFQKAIESSGRELMKCAIQQNHFQIAEYLLDHDCENHTGYDDPPLLHQVVTNPKATSFIKKLLTSGVDIDEADICDCVPLHWACLGGVSQNAEALLNFGAKYDLKNINGETPLHVAVRNYHVECVRLLLEAGADANVRTEVVQGTAYNWRPPDQILGHMPLDFMMNDLFDTFSPQILDLLKVLCICCPFSVEEVLLNLKSLETLEGNVKWDKIETQLHIVDILLKYGGESGHAAIKKENHDVASGRYFLVLSEFAANTDLNVEDGSPSLFEAIKRSDFALAKHFMIHGTHTKPLSALLVNELKQHHPSFKYIDLLLELGADVNAQESSYLDGTALHMVSNYNRHRYKDLSIRLLEKLSKKAHTIDPQDSIGYTPLMRVASSTPCNFKLMKSFLDLKADPNHSSHRGHTLCSIAIHRDPHLLSFFMEYGLSIDMAKVFNSSDTITELMYIDIPRDKDKVLTVKKFQCSKKLAEERRSYVKSYLRQTFPNCPTNVFNNLTDFLVDLLRGSSMERKFCCTISEGPAVFFVEAENYLLLRKSPFLIDYHLAGLLQYRIGYPESAPSDYYRVVLDKEIRSMESHVLWGSRTLYRLMQSEVDKVAAILKNVNVDSIQAILFSDLLDESSYPIMSGVIEKHLRDAICLMNTLSFASFAINNVFFSSTSTSSCFSTLPDHIVEKIVSHLSNSDLCNLICSYFEVNDNLVKDLKTGWWEKLNCIAKRGNDAF